MDLDTFRQVTDPLTGLADRAPFRNRPTHPIAAAARQRCRACLLMLDPDGFKEINDRLGHHAGDADGLPRCADPAMYEATRRGLRCTVYAAVPAPAFPRSAAATTGRS
ncbi:MAG TPA: diguanylate cyclase [Geminicoccaceae bacterium]|nr:diguanylate cyclase [Geminicoccaceae bacterium]